MRLDAIAPGDRARVGGKAFNCARLKQAGFPVPDGIVISSDATDAEIAAAGRRSVARRRAGGHAVRRAVVGHRRGQRGALVRGHSRDAPERRAQSARRGGAGVPPLRRVGAGARLSSGASARRRRGADRRARAAHGAGRHVGRGIHDQPGHRRRRARHQRRPWAWRSARQRPDRSGRIPNQQARRDGAVGALRLGRKRDRRRGGAVGRAAGDARRAARAHRTALRQSAGRRVVP